MSVLIIEGDSAAITDRYLTRTNHYDDAGLDLYTVDDIVVPAHGMATLDFGIRCMRIMQTQMGSVASKCGYLLAPRSSISNTPLRMANSVGIIDAGYRGNIMAKVDNISGEDYTIKAGTRLFQICMPDLGPFSVQIGAVAKNTERGAGGFGSTGPMGPTTGGGGAGPIGPSTITGSAVRSERAAPSTR